MKTCTRCSGKLDTGAKAARSEVCSGCASDAGELTAVAAVPIFTLSTWADLERLQLPRVRTDTG